MRVPLSSPITVRLAGVDDLDALANLNDQVQLLHFTAEPWEYKEPNHDAALAHFETVFGEGKLIVLLAECDGAALGYLMAEEVRRADNARKHGTSFLYVHHVAANEIFRRRGVGTALINRAIDFANERGLTDLRLNTGTFNAQAQEFFRMQGFDNFEIRMLRRAK